MTYRQILRLLSVTAVGLTLSWLQPASAVTLERIEASVNSSIIKLSDVDNFRRTLTLRSQLDPLFQNTPLAKKKKKSKKEIVDFLVDEKVISQAFPIADREVDQEINSIQANNRINRSTLEGAIQQQGFRFTDYFELIRISLSKRNLIDRDIRTKVYISDDDIKNFFYNEFTGSKKGTLSYRIGLVTIDPSAYDKTSQAKKAANSVREVMVSNTFEKALDSITQNGITGSDLGFLRFEELSPAFKTQVKGMKVGQTSPVLGSSKQGFFVLKLIDLRSGKEDQLKSAENQIRATLTSREYQRQIELWIDREKQKAYVRKAGDPAIPKAYRK